MLFCVLPTSEIISGWELTCDSSHSWRLYSAAHWETRPPAPWPYIALSHIILTLSHHYPNNDEYLDMKQQVSILESLVWLFQGVNSRSSDSSISQNDDRLLNYPPISLDRTLTSPSRYTLWVYIYIMIPVKLLCLLIHLNPNHDIYMWRVPFQNAIKANPKIAVCNDNAKVGDHVFEKSSS